MNVKKKIKRSSAAVSPANGFRVHKAAIAVSMAISLAVMLTVTFIVLGSNVKTSRERCGYIAENEAEHITTTIDCVMARTYTLTALIRDHYGDISFFDKVADDIYENVKTDTGVTLKNVAVAPDGVVEAVYPLEGNESFIGFDLLDQSRAGNREAEAYEKGDTVLTNPFELIQGGKGMAGRAPVIVETDEGEKFWGLATITIDFDNLLEVLSFENLKGMGMAYKLSYIEDDGTAVSMDFSGIVDTDAVTKRFSVRNLTWELKVSPENGWYSIPKIIFTVFIMLILSVFTGLFVNMFITFRQTNSLLLFDSNTDRLSGCFNRRAYEDDMARLVKTPPGADFVCGSFDINGLKVENDTKGHAAGDELLSAAAESLKETFESYGTVYRIGGDEFAVFFFADAQKLAELQKNLCATAKSKKLRSGAELSVSCGFAAQSEFPGMTADKLSRLADQRMYEAKRRHYEEKGNDRRQSRE